MNSDAERVLNQMLRSAGVDTSTSAEPRFHDVIRSSWTIFSVDSVLSEINALANLATVVRNYYGAKQSSDAPVAEEAKVIKFALRKLAASIDVDLNNLTAIASYASPHTTAWLVYVKATESIFYQVGVHTVGNAARIIGMQRAD